MNPQRTAFVTGATGFLGLNVVEQLAQSGWKVTALHRRQSNLTYLKRFAVDLAEGDIEDRASLERAVPPQSDAVFHVAADVSFWAKNNARQVRCNVDGTRNLVAVALAKGVRKFVHTSTTSVYGFQPQPFDESAAHLGKDAWVNYMRTKTQAEEEVRQGIAQGLDAVLLNPGNIIGRYDRNGWGRMLRLALAGKLFLVPPGSCGFCHATAVAQAHRAAVEHGRKGENYVLGGADASYRELIETLGAVAGQPLRIRTGGKLLFRLAGRLGARISRWTGREPMITPEAAAYLSAHLICRSDKAIRELGYTPVPLRNMVEDWYQWMKAEGM
jgi:nucleoside-diphosphate-sugar epimerase